MNLLFKNKNDPNSPVQVAIAPDEMVANIWQDALRENGIRCLLQSINLVESMYTAPITLRFRVMVMPREKEKALQILAPFLEDPDSLEDQSENQPDSTG